MLSIDFLASVDNRDELMEFGDRFILFLRSSILASLFLAKVSVSLGVSFPLFSLDNDFKIHCVS